VAGQGGQALERPGGVTDRPRVVAEGRDELTRGEHAGRRRPVRGAPDGEIEEAAGEDLGHVAQHTAVGGRLEHGGEGGAGLAGADLAFVASAQAPCTTPSKESGGLSSASLVIPGWTSAVSMAMTAPALSPKTRSAPQ
jgi:hypothetical protein